MFLYQVQACGWKSQNYFEFKENLFTIRNTIDNIYRMHTMNGQEQYNIVVIILK